MLRRTLNYKKHITLGALCLMPYMRLRHAFNDTGFSQLLFSSPSASLVPLFSVLSYFHHLCCRIFESYLLIPQNLELTIPTQALETDPSIHPKRTLETYLLNPFHLMLSQPSNRLFHPSKTHLYLDFRGCCEFI